jgi:GWxTD domain-containing protein
LAGAVSWKVETIFLEGVMRASRIWILVGLVCFGGFAGSALAGVSTPLQGIGEVPFSADIPVFVDGTDGWRLHLTARIFERDLVRPHPGQPKRLTLEFKLARSGVVTLDTTSTIEFVPRDVSDVFEDSWTEPFRLIEIHAPVTEGTWAVTLELSDADGGSSRATGVLAVDPARAPRISDPEFRLSTPNGTLPWPDRVYGLNQDTLEVYLEIEVPAEDSFTGPRPFGFEVHDPRYGVLDEQRLLLTLEPGQNAAIWRLPVVDFPEGSYGLMVVPPWSEVARPLSEFSVSWRIDRALEGGDELLVEAELALLPDDFERFQRLSRARQIELLNDFWSVVDPTPGTDRNEVRDRFRARIANANRIYSSRTGPGALTDRGRTLVRYGEPEMVDTEVMPLNGDDLEIAIRDLHDIFTPEVDGVMARGDIYGSSGGTGPRRPMDLPGTQSPAAVDWSGDAVLDLRRNAARVGREGAFEVWKYRSEGDPLLEIHRLGMPEQQHLRFIFVDRRGVGDYRLEFSNVPTQR